MAQRGRGRGQEALAEQWLLDVISKHWLLFLTTYMVALAIRGTLWPSPHPQPRLENHPLMPWLWDRWAVAGGAYAYTMVQLRVIGHPDRRKILPWFFYLANFMHARTSFVRDGFTATLGVQMLLAAGFAVFDAICPLLAGLAGVPDPITADNDTGVGPDESSDDSDCDEPTLPMAALILGINFKRSWVPFIHGTDGVIELGRRQRMLTRLKGDTKPVMRMQITVRSVEIHPYLRRQGRFTAILRYARGRPPPHLSLSVPFTRGAYTQGAGVQGSRDPARGRLQPVARREARGVPALVPALPRPDLQRGQAVGRPVLLPREPRRRRAPVLSQAHQKKGQTRRRSHLSLSVDRPGTRTQNLLIRSQMR